MTYFILLPLVLLMELVAFILSPVLPLFAEKLYLPKWLSWFQTPDASLMGDGGHFERHMDSSTYWQMVTWLARNRGYGFKWSFAGCEQQEYSAKGNPNIKNRYDAVAGYLYLKGDTHWYIKIIQPIGFNYCIQLAFGWQLDSPINGRCLFMFSPRITAFYPKDKQ